jgi:hypothetical protein
MKALTRTLLFAFVFFTSAAFAQQGVVAPAAFPNARVLPKGVRNLNYKGLFVEADEKFNRHGDKRVLGDPLNSGMTFGSMIDGQYSAQDKASLEAKMIEIGRNRSDAFGQTTGQVNATASVSVPIIAMGITEKTTAAIVIPIVRTSINVSTGVLQTNAALYNEFRDSISVSQGALAEFDRKTADPINSSLEEYGYDKLENINDTRLGDIRLVLKHQLTQTDKNRFAVSFSANLPTGQQADPNKVIDIQAGDGQTDVGIGFAHDYRITPALDFTTNVEYMAQLGDSETKRIPYSFTTRLSPDVDDNVDRDLGDIMHVQFALQFAKNGLNAAAGYSLQYKARDEYTGTKYAAERYDWLGRETQQRMQAFQASLGYDTITLFKQEKFPAPLRAALTYIAPFEGKNVTSNPTTTFDLSLFF